MCVHTPPLRLKSSVRGKRVQFRGCSWSFLGASRGCNWGSEGVQLEFFGEPKRVLLEVSYPNGVQLDVFRNLKGVPVEIFWSFK